MAWRAPLPVDGGSPLTWCTIAYMLSAEKIRARRHELGLTQKQLAAACGVERKAVIAWERGENIRRAMIPVIAGALQATAEELA